MNYYIIFTLLGLVLVAGTNIINAQSENPLDDRIIGYEFLNNGTVVHAWNQYLDYYWDADSGLQFTNHYEQYWTKNIYCIGYKTTEWNYKCNDELNDFNWNLQTDNETYFEAIGWKDTTIQGYDVRMALRYYLNTTNKGWLVIQPYLENRDYRDIPVDIGFAWHTRDIQVGMEEENNSINVGYEYFYNLSDNLTQSISGLTNAEYLVQNSNFEWYGVKWDKNLNYRLDIISVPSQYNAPITLGINAGTLASGKNKTTEILWKDATCGGKWGNASVVNANSGRGDSSFLNWSFPSASHPDLNDGRGDYLRFSDEYTSNANLSCFQNGVSCPVAPTEGICAPPAGQGYLRCSIQARYNNLNGSDYPDKQTTDNWNNSPNDNAWATLDTSIIGSNCGEDDGTSSSGNNPAIVQNFALGHDNFTDLRCYVDSLVWVGGFPAGCGINPQGSDKLDNWWGNHNSPDAYNVNVTPFDVNSTSNLTCVYDYLDIDLTGSAENTSGTYFNWTKDGVEQTGLNMQEIDSSNILPKENWTCGVTPKDSVFNTHYENRTNSTDVYIKNESCHYPWVGDWLVQVPQICVGERIILGDGDLLLQNSLIFLNSTIKSNQTPWFVRGTGIGRFTGDTLSRWI